MERENMRVIISKRMIREALIKLLQTKNIEKITITELCREAQVNRTTFYNHYELPIDVLNEMSWEIVRKIEEIYQGKYSEREATLKTLNYLNDHRDLLRVIFSANVAQSIYETAIKAFSHFWDVVSVKKKLHLNDDEYRLAVTGLGWTGYHIIRQWIMDDADLSAEQVLSLMDKLFGELL